MNYGIGVLTIGLLIFTGCRLAYFAESPAKSFRSASCASPGQPSIKIYLTNLGWHSGIVVPSESVKKVLEVLSAELQFPWIEIGWGDKEFYRSSGYSYWKGLKALSFSSGTALHVAGVKGSPESFFKDVQICELKVDRHRFEQLLQYIRRHVAVDPNGNPIRLGEALYGTGSFYESTGSFSLWRNCNSWTAEALKIAGCEVSASVLSSKRLFQQVCPVG